VADPGEGIQIAGGTYPAQRIRVDQSKVAASADVVFFPAPGQTVAIDGNLEMLGSHAIFRGSANPSNFKLRVLSSEAVAGATTSNHVTFENLDGAAFSIGPNRNITISGGDWGPNVICRDPGAEENKIGPDGDIADQVPENILLTGLYIHDQNSANLSRCHMGGLMVISANGLTIRRTVFSQTVVYDMTVGDFTGEYGNPRRVVLENNWFGAPVEGLPHDTVNDGQPELQFSDAGLFDDWLIRFNSWHNGLRLAWDSDATWRNIRVVGNAGGTMDCNETDANVTWSQNAWVDRPCDGTTDIRLSSLPFVDSDPGSEDFHLSGGPAVDLVGETGPDATLGTDFDLEARPQGAARDAGSDELR
jgi:hypothetical protein